MFVERIATQYREEPMLYYCDRDENLEPGAHFGPIIRDTYIVECCVGGYGSISINGVEFPVKAGDCYVLLPGDAVIHTADLHQPRWGVWCAIDGFPLGSIFAKAGISAKAPFAPPEAFPEILQQVEAMIQAKGDTDSGADLRRTSYIYAMLGALQKYAAPPADKNLWIQKAIGIMETRYHEALSIQMLADETGLDRSYFSTLFKEQTGLSPHTYLTSLRIKKATTLLRQRGCSVSDVSAAVGIDPQNFARLFKRMTGTTPREYKKNC